jgi:hypothetical protein
MVHFISIIGAENLKGRDHGTAVHMWEENIKTDLKRNGISLCKTDSAAFRYHVS